MAMHICRAVLLLALGAMFTMSAAQAAATACGPMSGVQKRVMEKHMQGGSEALRRFVWITRGIYELDMSETLAWAEERAQACRR